MIGPIITLFARWGIAEGLRKPLAWASAITLLIALLSLGKCVYDRNLIGDYEREATAQATASASAAAVEASDAVTATKTEVEKSNAEARDAANRGNDPLGDGLRSLRAAKGEARPSPR